MTIEVSKSSLTAEVSEIPATAETTQLEEEKSESEKSHFSGLISKLKEDSVHRAITPPHSQQSEDQPSQPVVVYSTGIAQLEEEKSEFANIKTRQSVSEQDEESANKRLDEEEKGIAEEEKKTAWFNEKEYYEYREKREKGRCSSLPALLEWHEWIEIKRETGTGPDAGELW